ncbi:MAG: SCP2 sterol-binding domain-containing protein [Myxococcota bacterium]
MSETAPHPPPTLKPVEQAFARLESVLRANAKRFGAVGGDVAFFVKGAKPPSWQVTSLAGEVMIRPGTPPFPVCTIGIADRALPWLVDGTLDVPRAFKERWLVVEGDLDALKRFVRCLAPPESSDDPE